jgi:hypothetical protein
MWSSLSGNFYALSEREPGSTMRELQKRSPSIVTGEDYDRRRFHLSVNEFLFHSAQDTILPGWILCPSASGRG